MTLHNIYRKSVIYPALIVLVMATIFSIIINQNYESEWLTRKFVIQLDIIEALVYGLLISLLALTIFLNRYERVSSNSILSALSWFLIPGGFMCCVIGKALNEYFTVGSIYEIFYATILNLPFMAGLIWGFGKFKRLQHR